MDEKSIKILLIEDNPGDALLLRELLEETAIHFELVHAKRLAAGLQRLNQEQFDLLLLDLGLPDSQGLETLRQTRAHVSDIPVILLTGLNDHALAKQAVQAGVQDYLVKGQLDSNLLARAVSHAIERQRLYLDLQRKTSDLLYSEARFHNMIEHNADSMVILDETGMILFANPAAEVLFNHESQPLLGKKLDISLESDTRSELEIIGSGGQEAAATVEVRVVETVWEGKTAYLASLREITERKQAEARLQEYSMQLEDMVDKRTRKLERRMNELSALNATAAIINQSPGVDQILNRVIGEALQLVGAESAAVHLLDEMTGMLVLAVHRGVSADLVRATSLLKLGQGLPGQVAQTGQLAVIGQAADYPGPLRSLIEKEQLNSIAGVPLIGSKGVIGTMSVGTARPDYFDANSQTFLINLGQQIAVGLERARLYAETQAWAGELELRIEARSADLVASEARYRTVFDSTVDGLFICDMQGRYLDVNPAACQLLGYSREELLAMTAMQVGLHGKKLSPEQEAERLAQLRAIWRTEASGYESQLVTKTGQVLEIEMTIAPVVYREQEAVLAAVRDITERKLIERQLEQRAAQLALISDIGRQIAAVLELDEVFHQATQLVQQSFDYDHVALFLVQEDNLCLKAVAGAYETHFLPGHTEPLDEGINGWVGSHGQKIVANDVSSEPRHTSAPYTVTQAELCLPIKIAQETVGVLDIQSPVLNAFDDNDVIALETLTDQIAIAIENANLYKALRTELIERKQVEEKIRHRNQELALFNQIIAAPEAGLGVKAILELVCRELINIFGMSQAAATMLNRGRTETIAVARYSTKEEPETLPQTTPVGDDPLFQSLLRHKKPLAVSNRQHQASPLTLAGEAGQTGPISLLLLPLIIEEEVVGSLSLETFEPRQFSVEEVNLVRSVIEQVAGTLARIQLVQLRQRLNTAMEQTADSIIITDKAGAILYVNPAFEQISGYSYDEAIGQSPRILKSNYQKVATYKAMWNTIGAGKVWQGQLVNKTRDGDLYTVDASISPVRDQSGAIVSYVAVQRDVTHQLQLEEQFRQVISSISDHIYVTTITEDGRYLNDYLSPNITTLTGYPLKKFTSDWSFWPSVVIHPDDRALAAAQAKQLSKGRNSETEYRLVRADGEIIWVRDSGRVQVEKRRKTIYGVVSDITERKWHEQELAYERASLARRVEERTAELSAANVELARAARLKDEFFANMSHELRTPLNAILGMSEVLRLNVYGQLNAEQLRALGYVEEGGRHLLSLINDILDLSKIEAGKIELDIRPVVVEDVCQASLRFVKQQAQKKQIRILSVFDSVVDIVPADERRLKQVFVNLLNNAVKFTPEGGQIGLEVEGNKGEGVVHFCVWDTGIGIAEADMKSLFEPFVQIDSRLARQHEGTGLGLALVARLVEMHGGGVAVESTVGEGSRFTVSLPWPDSETEVKKGIDEQDTQQALLSPHPAAPAPLSTILLVEDNETNIVTFRDFLRSRGYQVITAHDGAEAINQAKASRPDVILMDIQMPGMDGLEATRRLREDDAPEVAAIPIIALTALAMPGDRERCLNAGASDYLSKPVSLVKLLNAIEAQLKETQ